MNFTAALRISNCRESLASLPRLHCSLVPKGTRKRVRASPSQKFVSKSISIRPRLSKKGNVVVVVIVVVVVVAILRYLGLCREQGAPKAREGKRPFN